MVAKCEEAKGESKSFTGSGSLALIRSWCQPNSMPVASCRLAPRSLSATAVEACCFVGQGGASKADRKNIWTTTVAYSRPINNCIFLLQ